MFEEHMSLGNIVYISCIIAAYIWAIYYLFFVIIPRRVAYKKFKVAEKFDTIKKLIGEMQEEQIKVEEILTKWPKKIEIKGYKYEYLSPGIEKTKREYAKFLQKPPGYYAGKNLIALFKLMQLDAKLGYLEDDHEGVKMLIKDLEKFVGRS